MLLLYSTNKGYLARTFLMAFLVPVEVRQESLSELRCRYAIKTLKRSRKVRHLLETEFVGDAFDGAQLLQQRRGSAHSLLIQPCLRAASEVLVEAAAQLAGRDVAEPC